MKRIEIPKKELKNLYKKKKLTTYKIADIYGCCQATIWKRLHKFNIKTRTPWKSVNLSKKKLYDLYVKEKLSTWKIEEQYGYPRSTVYRKLCEYGIKRRSRAKSHIIYPRKDFDGSLSDKSHLIGFAMGDLRVRKKYPNSETINVDCGSNKIEQINLISKLFKSYGRIWIKKQPKRKRYFQIECLVNLSFKFLLKKRILVDRWILESKKYFVPFLAGFTDADGSIFISNKQQATYALSNYNHELLAQIRKRLIELKINCGSLIEDNRKGQKIKGTKTYTYNQNYWHFSISKKVALLKLFKLMGSYLKHTKRIKDMKRAKRNIKSRNRKYGYINMPSRII